MTYSPYGGFQIPTNVRGSSATGGFIRRFEVPTNVELEARGPSTAQKAVENWLRNHPRPQPMPDHWIEWAAQNLLADPEIRGFIRRKRSLRTRLRIALARRK